MKDKTKLSKGKLTVTAPISENGEYYVHADEYLFNAGEYGMIKLSDLIKRIETLENFLMI